MASGLNKVMLLGNLGADPELKVTSGGQAVLKMRLAVSESYLDKSGTKQERTEWVSISLWGKRGEALSKFLTKGERIFVEGSLRTSSYEKDGEKRYRTEVNATNAILCGRKRDGAADPADDSPPRETRSRAAPAQAQSEPADDFGGDYSGADDDSIPF